jgi:hypothetical protein
VAEPKTRDEVLRLMREGRARLEAALARVPSDQLEQPGVGGGEWTASDLMAHVAYWEAAMLDRLGVATSVSMESGPVDQINQAVCDRNRGRRLDDVRGEFEGIHGQLIDRVTAMSDDELNRPLAGRDGQEPLWEHIANETWTHYPEHVEVLEAWIGARR